MEMSCRFHLISGLLVAGDPKFRPERRRGGGIATDKRRDGVQGLSGRAGGSNPYCCDRGDTRGTCLSLPRRCVHSAQDICEMRGTAPMVITVHESLGAVTEALRLMPLAQAEGRSITAEAGRRRIRWTTDRFWPTFTRR